MFENGSENSSEMCSVARDVIWLQQENWMRDPVTRRHHALEEVRIHSRDDGE